MPDYAATAADDAMLHALTEALRRGSVDLAHIDALAADTSFPRAWQRIALVLYAPGQQRLLVSRKADVAQRISTVLAALLQHSRCTALTQAAFRLQIDFVVEPPVPADFLSLSVAQEGEHHFEPGIDGLIFKTSDDQTHIFLPGDAFVRSIMGMQQLRDYLFRAYGEDNIRPARCWRFRAESYISNAQGDHWLRLYRGYPLVGALTKEKVEKAVELAVAHVLRTQEADGRFLYYYDAALDSRRDHEHLTRDPVKNPFYNILRHGGGALTCLFREKYHRTNETLPVVRKAIEFYLPHAREYDCAGQTAAYIYSEKKAKLGGSGIALYVLSEYQLMTGDATYRPLADKLGWHLLHQITESGEFIYYHVYLDKFIDAAENGNYFSFYYPGEAVCGLAKYLHLLDADERAPYFERLHRALHFLIHIRPKTRADQYTVVPSDAWLMMGIMELWDFAEMRQPDYAAFVFADAQQMIDHLYKLADAPYPDYAGAFYYQFGDYPYADGARCEGLLGAYELALKMGDRERAASIWSALKLAAWAVMHLVNTEDAIYFARNPHLSLGGIRFKYTRQWFRIDTIQHVASFFAKLLPHWDAAPVAVEGRATGAVLYNHDIRSAGAASLELSWLYSGRALCLTAPGDLIQLSPDLHSQWAWIQAHYARAGIACTQEAIWDLRSKIARDHPDHVLSVFYFGDAEQRYRPDEERYHATARFNSKNEFIRHAAAAGVSVPRTLCYAAAAELGDAFVDLPFPLYLKPAVSLSGIGVQRCEDAAALRAELAALSPGEPFQLQEEIAPARFFNVQYHAAGARAKRLLVSEQVLEGNAHRGNRAPCDWSPPAALDHLADTIAAAGLRDIFAFDVAVRNDGAYYVIECNPRVNSSSYPTLLARRLGVGQWSTLTLPTRQRDLGQLDLAGIEYDPATQSGTVVINWGTILHGELMVMLIGDAQRQAQLLDELKRRLARLHPPVEHTLLLTPHEIARISGGKWQHLLSQEVALSGVNFHLPLVTTGDLFVWLNRDQLPKSEARLAIERAHQRGAVAAVVPTDCAESAPLPLLVVADPMKALQDMAMAASLKFDGRRVLVAGSHGKTGFKTQLHHLIHTQISTHAHLDSNNLEAPVYKTLAAIPRGASVAIIEVAVPYRGIGENRAFFVRPDICVLTGIAPEHMSSHETLDNLIRNKATVVTGLRPSGCCVLNADDPHYPQLFAAVRALTDFPVLRFGSAPDCEGRLLGADFGTEGWQVHARIAGTEIIYTLPMLEDYAPLASVGVLLTAQILGADPSASAANYTSYQNYESSGNLYRVNMGQGSFHVYDQTQRGELKGFESMFELMSRMKIRGRKIAIVSEFINFEDNPGDWVDIPRMRSLMEKAGIDLLFTVKDFRRFADAVPQSTDWRAHGESCADIQDSLLAEIGPGDMIFLRGVLKANLGQLSRKLLDLGTGTAPYVRIY